MNHPPFRPILTDRQTRILALTERQGFVTIERLAAQFGVSAQTIRRDIIALADVGKLQRFHGGAGPGGNAETLRLDHGYKEKVAVEEKIQVARQAAAMVPDDASVYLDVGTTLEFTAKYLCERRGLRIFTNSMRTALTFDPAQQEIIVIGGRVAGKDGSLVGEDIVATLNGLRIDFALIGCSAIDNRGRVMDFDMSKIAVKKAAMAAAERRFLLATPSKFGRTALATLAAVKDFDAVIDGAADN